jgi:thioredoxin-related protein
MKVDVFKKLIKESVREVLREELSALQSQPIQENKTMSFTSQDVDMTAYRKNLANMMGLQTPPTYNGYQPTSPKVQSTGNPYLDIIAETAATMTPQELAQMRQYSE